MPLSDIGLIGLAVMGSNLARNIAGHRYHVSIYNRTQEKTQTLLERYGTAYLHGEKTLQALVASLERPRKIILMVKAGGAVDDVIQELVPLLSPGDLIIDCGNSYYRDTMRRYQALQEKGILFMGCGVSGGEEGALKGPSLMPGGDRTAWNMTRKIWQAIAAKDFSGKPCVTYVGDNGAGHYVKMVHNGIEYGIMQIMAEAYDILRSVYQLGAPDIARIFQRFQKGKLNSYLLEIAVPVLMRPDEFQKGYLLDHILDRAGQKGTGQWVAVDALERGVALPTITEAVFARLVSSQKKLRQELNRLYVAKTKQKKITLTQFTKLLEDALYAAILCAYAQGYHLIQTAAKTEQWTIHLGEISRIWEGGCIIRAKILNFLQQAYQKNADHETYLLAIPEIRKALKKSLPQLRQIVALASQTGVPVPSMGASLSYADSMTRAVSSANFIQGLRDYFGAHTYERTDRPGTFHTLWNE